MAWFQTFQKSHQFIYFLCMVYKWVKMWYTYSLFPILNEIYMVNEMGYCRLVNGAK